MKFSKLSEETEETKEKKEYSNYLKELPETKVSISDSKIPLVKADEPKIVVTEESINK